VSTGVSWTYNRARLSEALDTWKATAPDEVAVAAINEALMDLIEDPLGWGREDPASPGVFNGTVRIPTGGRVGILYTVADLESGIVAVADIRTERALP